MPRQTSTIGVSWNASLPSTLRADLAGDGDDRDRVHLGVGEAGDEVGRAGAAGGDADAGLAGGAGVAVGHEPAALLVPRQDGAELLGDRVSAWWIGMMPRRDRRRPYRRRAG